MVALFCPPFLFSFVVVVRLIRVIRAFQDPARLRSLLSARSRAALAEAGLDPDAVTLQEIQAVPELQEVVGQELRTVLRSAMLGGAPPRPDTAAVAPVHTAASLAGLPEPIDSPAGGRRLGVVLALALVGLGALAFVLADLLH